MAPAAPRPARHGVVALALAAIAGGCSLDASLADPLAHTTDAPPDAGALRPPPAVEGRFTVRRGLLGDVSARVAVGDCDGDGTLDVAALGPGDFATGSLAPKPWPAVWRGDGTGRFRRERRTLDDAGAGAGAFVDLDDDGVLDLITTDTDVRWHRGAGDCRFDPPVSLGGLRDEAAGASAVTVGDYDLDGLTDLGIALRGSTPVPFVLMLARGDGRYERVEPGVYGSREYADAEGFLPFVLFADDLDDDGAQDLFSLVDYTASWLSWGDPSRPAAWSNAPALTALFARTDPMAVAPIDIDRDGRMEFFVSGVLGASRVLSRGVGRDVRDLGYEVGLEGETQDFAWGSWAADLDLDGWTNLLVLREGPRETGRAPGPVDLYLRRDDGSFADVGASAVGERFNARTLLCGDLDGRATRGCLVLDAYGNALLRDDLRPRGRWAGLSLRGRVSSPDASGARVRVAASPRPVSMYYGGQATQGGEHDRRLVVAAGAGDGCEVTVRWPSGITQRVPDVPTGRYTVIDEPRALAVSRRVAPADGRAEVRVTVDPRAAGASAATIERDGAGEWEGDAAVQPDGRVTRVLRAPTGTGEARLRIGLDGVALRVRPRVRFE